MRLTLAECPYFRVGIVVWARVMECLKGELSTVSASDLWWRRDVGYCNGTYTKITEVASGFFWWVENIIAGTVLLAVHRCVWERYSGEIRLITVPELGIRRDS